VASSQHNFIVSVISGKLQKNGFKIIYLDGVYADFTMTKKNIPPTIINHRPDVIGENESGHFIIGEAKTISDLATQRTKNQFLDFLSFISIEKNNRLIIGIDSDSENVLKKLLQALNIINHAQLEIVVVPALLLPKEENEGV
jgi:hypothetical protein